MWTPTSRVLAWTIGLVAAASLGCGDDDRGPVVDAGALPGVDAATSSGVGAACLPESVPSGGFVASEAYLETSSLACTTRVCMVYQLAGVPFGAAGCTTAAEVAANPDCATEEETMARVYCSCRCDAPPGVTAELCTCMEGFSCVEVIDSPTASDAIRGSYCVRDGTFGL